MFLAILITMLPSLKSTMFSTTVHRVSDIMEIVRKIFEISDTGLLDALCDVKTEGKNDVRHKYSGERIPFDLEQRYLIANKGDLVV